MINPFNSRQGGDRPRVEDGIRNAYNTLSAQHEAQFGVGLGLTESQLAKLSWSDIQVMQMAFKTRMIGVHFHRRQAELAERDRLSVSADAKRAAGERDGNQRFEQREAWVQARRAAEEAAASGPLAFVRRVAQALGLA